MLEFKAPQCTGYAIVRTYNGKTRVERCRRHTTADDQRCHQHHWQSAQDVSAHWQLTAASR